jgi:hypothetical protein
MTALLLALTIGMGTYITAPDWFETSPYGLIDEHKNLDVCKRNTLNTDNICVSNSDNLTVGEYRVEKGVETTTPAGVPLNFVECDYFAGCYQVERINK